MKIIAKALLIIISSILIGTLLLGLAYSIPVSKIEPKVQRAYQEVIKEEGLYPQVTKYAMSAIDNWTDSIMLMEAMFPTDDGAFKSAMLARRYDYNNGIPVEAMEQYFEHGAENCWVEEYSQYWHGYHIFLKPLLSVMEYSQIRILNGVVQSLFTLTICVILWKKNMKKYIFPYFLGILFIMPVAIARCMQYSSCFYIMSAASIAMLLSDRTKDPEEFRIFIFLCAGIAAAYFDFLTYTMVTIGVPAVFYLDMEESPKPGTAIKKLLLAVFAWICGYGLMWLGKFAVGSLITGKNLLAETASHVERWVGKGPEFSIAYVFYHSIRDFAYTPITAVAVIFALAIFIRILKNRVSLKGEKKFVENTIFSYFIVALLPFVYYIIMLNPSGVHFGLFGNKALLVSAFAGLSLLTKLYIKQGKIVNMEK